MITPWIAIFGGLGAVARFVADGLLRAALGRKFPWATLIINVAGSFLLGVITGLVLYRHGNLDLKSVVGTGFCGGFTTFSTASFETARLIEERRFFATIFQSMGNLCLAFIAAAIGIMLVR